MKSFQATVHKAYNSKIHTCTLTLWEPKRIKIVPEILLGILEYLCEIKKVKES